MIMEKVHVLLPVLAIFFAAVGIAKPTYPLVAVAVLLLAINALIR